MRKILRIILNFLNIKPDPAVARSENAFSLKLALGVGLADCILVLLLEKKYLSTASYGSMISLGFVVCLILFCFFNWSDFDYWITPMAELFFLLALLFIAFFDCLTREAVPVFAFPVALVLLPLAIFDRPWKILLIILIASSAALSFVWHDPDSELLGQNLIRIYSAAALSCVISCYFAYDRIRAVKLRQSTQQIAKRDPLTGIYNRGGGTMLIQDCIEMQQSGMFLVIDIDDFKHVNDNYGHQKGDEILKAVADILRASFKNTDIVMRMGGDEFVIYAVGMVDFSICSMRLKMLTEKIRHIAISEEDGCHVTVSIGGVINDGSYPTYDALFHSADHVLYKKKSEGKDGYLLYDVSYR